MNLIFIFEAFNDIKADNETNSLNQDDMLDVVGRGYLSNYDVNLGQENFEQNQTPEVLEPLKKF